MKNQCNFIGNLGADPTVREMQNGGKIVSFDIAITDKWKDKDGQPRESTQWVPIVIFNENLGRIAEAYLKKGSKVAITGAFQTRSWESEGQKKYKSEIVLQRYNGDLTLLDSRNAEGGTESPSNNTSAFDDNFDDAPF